jgi:hypothetical protein
LNVQPGAYKAPSLPLSYFGSVEQPIGLPHRFRLKDLGDLYHYVDHQLG